MLLLPRCLCRGQKRAPSSMIIHLGTTVSKTLWNEAGHRGHPPSSNLGQDRSTRSGWHWGWCAQCGVSTFPISALLAVQFQPVPGREITGSSRQSPVCWAVFVVDYHANIIYINECHMHAPYTCVHIIHTHTVALHWKSPERRTPQSQWEHLLARNWFLNTIPYVKRTQAPWRNG